VVGRPREKPKGTGMMLVRLANSLQGVLDHYMWLDKVPLLEWSTGQVRKLICKSKDKLWRGLGSANRSKLQMAGVPQEKEIWKGF
jgi:hypothetical protein